MGRLMALDLGRRRCGIAVTDELQIVATGLATVPTSHLEEFLRNYLSANTVDYIVVGRPVNMSGEASDCTRYIEPVLNRLKKVFPEKRFEPVDERFTSTLAHRSMIEGGMKKSHRQLKENADVMAATIILNDYLQSRNYIERK